MFDELDKIFPNREDKITFLISSGITLALQLSGVRSAFKKDWGAAIWKTMVAYETNRHLRAVVEKQVAKQKLTPEPFAWYN